VEFFVGEETPLRDDVTTTTTPIGEQGDTLTTFQVKIVREELGTNVELTTFINEDGTVTLEFDGEISSPILGFSTVSVVNPQTGQTIEFPLDGKNTSEIKSILTAQSGQSIAIGGIIRETLDLQENKAPILGDIPFLGFFFREINNTKRKTETVIILTPHVILHPALAGRASKDFLGRKSSHGHITKGKENVLESTPPASGAGIQRDREQPGTEGGQIP
jgi:type II secretory pathway component GspD/PulD (secretin)